MILGVCMERTIEGVLVPTDGTFEVAFKMRLLKYIYTPLFLTVNQA